MYHKRWNFISKIVQGAPALAKGLDIDPEQQVPSKIVEVEEDVNAQANNQILIITCFPGILLRDCLCGIQCSLCLEPMAVGSSAAALPGCVCPLIFD